MFSLKYTKSYNEISCTHGCLTRTSVRDATFANIILPIDLSLAISFEPKKIFSFCKIHSTHL